MSLLERLATDMDAPAPHALGICLLRGVFLTPTYPFLILISKNLYARGKHCCMSLKPSHHQTNTTNTLAHSNRTVRL
jgi:hypothetical protein